MFRQNVRGFKDRPESLPNSHSYEYRTESEMKLASPYLATGIKHKKDEMSFKSFKNQNREIHFEE